MRVVRFAPVLAVVALVSNLHAQGRGAAGMKPQDTEQWQPVPKGLPAYGILAYVSGLVLIAGGVAMLSRKSERFGALLLAAFFGLWVVALHLPNAFQGWKHIGAWNAPAEFTFATMGGVALF